MLLENRIQFLTGNYTIKTGNDGNSLKAGIFFNYSLVNDDNVFNDLNIFYYKTLNCKRYSLGRRLSVLITPALKSRLKKYSFLHGFKNKVFYNFDNKRIKKISNCWK